MINDKISLNTMMHYPSDTVQKQESGLQVTSEIGLLQAAIVHTPGRELEYVTPRNFGRMLMDDILHPQATRQNHSQLVEVLKLAGVRVYEFRDLLYETILSLSEAEIQEFVDILCNLEGCTNDYRRRLHNLSPEGLTEVCIVGELQAVSLTRLLRQNLYALPPLPNLMFVRDAGAVVNHGMILGTMEHSERTRESFLFERVFRHHPVFRRTPVKTWLWLGENEERRNKYMDIRGARGVARVRVEGSHFRLRDRKTLRVGRGEFRASNALIASDDLILEAADLKFSIGENFVIEGGNILVLSADSLLIGCNERASAAAIDALAQEMLTYLSRINHIFVAVFATDKQFIHHHLDTGFAVLHRNLKDKKLECLVHQPMIEAMGANLTMVHMWFNQGQLQTEVLPDIKAVLRKVPAFAGLEPHFIYCGGTQDQTRMRTIYQEREWHHQAVNVLSISPNAIIAFKRNRETLKQLEANGYQIKSANSFIQEGKNNREEMLAELYHPDKKWVITIDDGELSRAHGGPRSLVLPLRRSLLF